MGAEVILGIDIGNSNLKFCLLDPHGTVVKTASASLRDSRFRLVVSAMEWEPSAIVHVLGSAVREFCESAGLDTSIIETLCISATAPDFWWLPTPTSSPSLGIGDSVSEVAFVDDHELARLVDLTNARSVWDVEFFVRAKRLNGRVNAGGPLFYQTKHCWLFCCLTGEYALDIPTATELGMAYDTQARRWRAELIQDYLGSDIILPTVVGTGTIRAPMRSEWLSAFGLRPGAQVALGSCDSFCSMLGSGCLFDGDIFIYYGTFFCAAVTEIQNSLTAETPAQPFRWRYSLPFAGRVVEELVCAMYNANPAVAFREFDNEMASSKARRSILAEIISLGRPHLIWEPVQFLLKPIGIGIHRRDFVAALLQAMSNGLASELSDEEKRGTLLASGGGARCSTWVSFVSTGLGRAQTAILGEHEGAGTALIGLLSSDRSVALRTLRTRREGAVAIGVGAR